MLTKVIAAGAVVILVGCGAKSAGNASADADSSKPAAVAPAGFDNSKIAAAQTIPAGTRIHVRLDQTVDTVRSGAGEKFSATLETPITVGESTVVPKGTAFRGHVTTSSESGRLKGRAVLGITLDSLELNGKSYKVETSADSRVSGGHKKRNGVMIGGGAGLGAAIGAAQRVVERRADRRRRGCRVAELQARGGARRTSRCSRDTAIFFL
jgi:hypothetical protein